MPRLPQDSSLIRFSNRTDDSDSFGEVSHKANSAIGQASRPFRSSAACVHCKSLKVRCEFNPGEKACQRCQAGNYQCVARSRKKRKPAPTHEDLQEKSHSQDRQIESLLLQFDKLKTEHKIRDWLAKAHSDHSSEDLIFDSTEQDVDHGIDRVKRSLAETSAELAATSYFRVQGMPTVPLPDVVKYCALYPEEILELFAIFFERVNPYFSILDPELHTPDRLIWTSPFLFTVICAVASRYYPKRPSLYYLAMEFSRDLAGRALIDGSKGVDVCQAYLLIAVYPVPKKKWCEDRSWLLMGVAIRMAIELELNLPPPPSCEERESLNRTRTWLNCFCVDGSHAIQFGKMPMLPLDDFVARSSRDWYKSSTMNSPFDIHLCAYVDIILLMAEWRSAMGKGYACSKYPDGIDVVSIALDYDEKLASKVSTWVELYADANRYIQSPMCAYRGNTTQLITAYLRLAVLATGFQHAVKTGISRESYIVKKSMDAARSVIHIMTDRLYPTGKLRYAMDANFLYVAFAAAFLINFFRPKFLPLLCESQHQEIIDIVEQLVRILGSGAVALDGRHTPALYSRFLSSLLKRHGTPYPRTRSPVCTEDVKFIPQYSEDRQQTPPNIYAWPDTMSVQPEIELTRHIEGPAHPDSVSTGMIYQQSGEADMDFSMNHFLQTVTAQGLSPPPADLNSSAPATDAFGNWAVHGDIYDIRSDIPTWPATQYSDIVWPVSKY